MPSVFTRSAMGEASTLLRLLNLKMLYDGQGLCKTRAWKPFETKPWDSASHRDQPLDENPQQAAKPFPTGTGAGRDEDGAQHGACSPRPQASAGPTRVARSASHSHLLCLLLHIRPRFPTRALRNHPRLTQPATPAVPEPQMRQKPPRPAAACEAAGPPWGRTDATCYASRRKSAVFPQTASFRKRR